MCADVWRTGSTGGGSCELSKTKMVEVTHFYWIFLTLFASKRILLKAVCPSYQSTACAADSSVSIEGLPAPWPPMSRHGARSHWRHLLAFLLFSGILSSIRQWCDCVSELEWAVSSSCCDACFRNIKLNRWDPAGGNSNSPLALLLPSPSLASSTPKWSGNTISIVTTISSAIVPRSNFADRGNESKRHDLNRWYFAISCCWP